MAQTLSERVWERIAGLECAALCEDAIVDRFADDLAMFHASQHTGEILRHVRCALDARDNAKRYREEASDWRSLLANVAAPAAHAQVIEGESSRETDLPTHETEPTNRSQGVGS